MNTKQLHKQLQTLSDGCKKLSAAGLETLSSARLLLAADEYQRQHGGRLGDIGTLSASIEMPISTASRIAWQLAQAEFLTIVHDPHDRRRRLLRPNLERAGLATTESA